MNRIVVITGASRGLGLSLASQFLNDGDEVIGVSRTKRHWSSATKSVGRQEKFSLFQVSLTSESQIKRFVQRVYRKHGRIDLVINNAGCGGPLAKIEDLSVRGWKKVFDDNLLSAFLMTKHTIPILKRQGKGVIINISSMAGQRAVPRLAAYSASKFGVVALSQAVAKENQEFGIHAFSVCPGGMNTTMRADLFGQEDAKKQQSTDYVADIIFQTVNGKIKVESGGDIVIRHGQISAIHPCPSA